MAVTIRIPTTLRTLTAGASEVSAEPGTVREVLAALDGAHPGFADRLLDEEGSLRRFVNVFVSDDDVRFMEGLDTPVPDGGRPSRSSRLSRAADPSPGSDRDFTGRPL